MSRELFIQRTPKQLGTINGIGVIKYDGRVSSMCDKLAGYTKSEPWLHLSFTTPFNRPKVGYIGFVYIWDTREVVGIVAAHNDSWRDICTEDREKLLVTVARDNFQPIRFSDELKKVLSSTKFSDSDRHIIETQLNIINRFFSKESERLLNKR